MEPLAPISNNLIRPVGGSEGIASLQEGRVLVGEVLQRMDAQKVLIQVAGKQVPAETEVELQPGDRFLVEVERNGDGLALRLLPEARVTTDPGLLDAVRHLMADERPLGRVLEDLAVALRAKLALGEDPKLEQLLRAVEGRRLDPAGGVEALRALLASDQQAWPAALAASLAEVGGDGLEAALRDLTAHLRLVLGALGAAEADLGALNKAMTAALRAMVLEGRAVSDPTELGRQFLAHLARELEHGGAQRAGVLVRDAGPASLQGREITLLRALLHTTGPLGARSELARGLSEQVLGSLGTDLRGRLAALMAELQSGPLHEAANRALAGLDLEDLLNAVRREAGEATHLSLPFPDGDGWATAHLLLLEREAPEGGAHDGNDDDEHSGASFRVVIGVEFSVLGKVRADLLVRDGAVAARVRASRPATAALLRQARGELEGLLGQEGRQVTLAVLDGTDEEVSVEPLTHDVRYLREHHLMDVEG